jgi:hypothetical protein
LNNTIIPSTIGKIALLAPAFHTIVQFDPELLYEIRIINRPINKGKLNVISKPACTRIELITKIDVYENDDDKGERTYLAFLLNS